MKLHKHGNDCSSWSSLWWVSIVHWSTIPPSHESSASDESSMDIVIVHETLPPCVVVSHLRGEMIGTQYSTSNTLPLVVTGSPLAVPYDEMNVMDKLWMWPIDEYKVAWLIQYKGRRPCTETFPKVLNSVLRNTTSYWNMNIPKRVSDLTLNFG